ncbi:MAG: 4-hydroxythreonine-4-phosphate dehydrogenase PdxA [Planctomycetota bacterium]
MFRMPPLPQPTIAVTLGDPGGIGPEVTAKALLDPHISALARWRILGPAQAWTSACKAAGLDATAFSIDLVPSSLSQSQPYDQLAMGSASRPTIGGGACSFAAVVDAIELAKRPLGDPLCAHAIVTAPISKEAWALAGHRQYPGHTELLAERFNTPDAKMFFHCPLPQGPGRPEHHSLNVVLVTVHVPLARVSGLLTMGVVLDAIRAGARACRSLGIAKPRVAVCGLNPHAGENGLLGIEEQQFISPAIELAREEGLEASGPWPGDTVFNRATRGDFDLVVAMYHDQGLIPVKLLGWDRAVNVTVGLPVPRTSPDHGTAFDIAGRGLADPGSMKAAMALAARMCVQGADRVTSRSSAPGTPPTAC